MEEARMLALQNVLVAVDFNDASEVALTYGRNLARAFGARLHAVHVLENSFLRARAADPHAVEGATSRQLLERLTDADRTTPDAVAVVRTSDQPADEIVGYAREQNIDLIIVGTHGRQGLAHVLLGSIAERVVRTAPCPVLTVRRTEHEFVVPDSFSREVDHDRAEEHPRRH
jgi:nucleotide-binding universal stress UspA family protein